MDKNTKKSFVLYKIKGYREKNDNYNDYFYVWYTVFLPYRLVFQLQFRILAVSSSAMLRLTIGKKELLLFILCTIQLLK